MISKKVEKVIIKQIQNEEQSSRIYMAMASWCEVNGFPGAAKFLYAHSDEERLHMTKLIKYLNDKGGYGVLQSLEMPDSKYNSLLSRSIIFMRLRFQRKIIPPDNSCNGISWNKLKKRVCSKAFSINSDLQAMKKAGYLCWIRNWTHLALRSLPPALLLEAMINFEL